MSYKYNVDDNTATDENGNTYPLNKVITIDNNKYYFKKYTKKNGVINIYRSKIQNTNMNKINKTAIIERVRKINKNQLNELDEILKRLNL